MFFHKKKTYEINMEQANAMLQNVFAACNQAPNTIPFDKLALRQKINIKPYNRLIMVTAIALLLTFISPLCIVPAANVMDALFTPEPIALLDDYVVDNILYLQLTGDGILYEEAYMETTTLEKHYATSYDAKEKLIGFPLINNCETNIYIPTKHGDTLHLLFSPQ